MHQIKTASVRLTWWPTPQDYNEAVQIPLANLQDPQLKSGHVYTDAIGLPRPVTGSFACVYRLHCDEKDFALRLFLRNMSDQQARYALISDFVQHDDLPYTVTFDFLHNGIKIMGEWLPALKMEWVEGTQFDDYIVENLANPHKLGSMAKRFLSMMDELRHAGIAHGDLQHGNIIVCAEELRLVDYDGMFVPKMTGFDASELGHRNYQHPARQASHFGPYLDNFSAWTIYTSLRALESDSKLFHQLGGGDDCLLFKQSDFLDPLHSPAFAALERHSDGEIQDLARFVRAQLQVDPAAVPYLQATPPKLTTILEPLSKDAASVRSGPRLERGALPDWLMQHNQDALVAKGGHTESSKSKPAPNKTPQQWAAQVKSKTAQWNTPAAAPSRIPPELRIAPPRNVQFYSKSGKCRPEPLQLLALFNPLAWLFTVILFMTLGPDEALRTNGVDYETTVTNVQRHYDHQDRSTWHTYVTYQYVVNGKKYAFENDLQVMADFIKVGDKNKIHALPSNPSVHEPLGTAPGTRQQLDLLRVLFLSVFVFGIEGAIWMPAIKQHRLATLGSPAMATITDTNISNQPRGPVIYTAKVRYDVLGRSYEKEIWVKKSEYWTLARGQFEPILYDPKNPSSFTLYKFCAYRPDMPPLPGSGTGSVTAQKASFATLTWWKNNP